VETLPAFCVDCGGIFDSGISVEAEHVPTSVVQPPGCPYCGGPGEVWLDAWTVLEETVVLMNPYVEGETEAAVFAIVWGAALDVDVARSAAEQLKAEAPTLKRFAEHMLSARAQAIVGWLALIIAIIELFQQNSLSGDVVSASKVRRVIATAMSLQGHTADS
jgi:hypothetical protein